MQLSVHLEAGSDVILWHQQALGKAWGWQQQHRAEKTQTDRSELRNWKQPAVGFKDAQTSELSNTFSPFVPSMLSMWCHRCLCDIICFLNLLLADQMSSCSARSLEETHLLMITSCWETTLVSVSWQQQKCSLHWELIKTDWPALNHSIISWWGKMITVCRGKIHSGEQRSTNRTERSKPALMQWTLFKDLIKALDQLRAARTQVLFSNIHSRRVQVKTVHPAHSSTVQMHSQNIHNMFSSKEIFCFKADLLDFS